MDWMNLRSRILEAVKQYRYVALVVLAGLLLMALPEKSEAPKAVTPSVQAEALSLQQALESILSQIEGAGKVRVLLTEATGAQNHFQMDEDSSSNADSRSVRRDTVLVTDSDRRETGLVVRTDPPVYQGAIVVCQGGNSSQVCLAISEAVANATGLSFDQITVLKMK